MYLFNFLTNIKTIKYHRIYLYYHSEKFYQTIFVHATFRNFNYPKILIIQKNFKRVALGAHADFILYEK